MVFEGFSDGTGESILHGLEAVYLGDVYVKEKRIALVLFNVDYRCTCSYGRCGFEIEHWADSSKVADMSEKDESCDVRTIPQVYKYSTEEFLPQCVFRLLI